MTLFYYEDRSVGECAAITELSEGNVNGAAPPDPEKTILYWVNDEMNGKE